MTGSPTPDAYYALRAPTLPIERFRMQPASGFKSAVKEKYDLDEAVWIELQGKPGLHEGRIVFGFRISTEPSDFYIIRLNDRAYPFLEVRDPLLMAPAADVKPPIALGKTSPPVPFAQP